MLIQQTRALHEHKDKLLVKYLFLFITAFFLPVTQSVLFSPRDLFETFVGENGDTSCCLGKFACNMRILINSSSGNS